MRLVTELGVVVGGTPRVIDKGVCCITPVSIDVELLINTLVDGKIWVQVVVALTAISTFGYCLLAVNAFTTHLEALCGLVKNELI